MKGNSERKKAYIEGSIRLIWAEYDSFTVTFFKCRHDKLKLSGVRWVNFDLKV